MEYPPSNVVVGAIGVWYHQLETSGGIHDGPEPASAAYLGSLMIIDKKSGVGVVNGSTKRLLQPADDGHAELMGRYEVTPPDCVTGPYVDISSVVQSHVEEDAGLPGIKRNPRTRIYLAIGPLVPVEDHWRCGGAGTLELQYLYAEPYHKAQLRQSGCAARLLGYDRRQVSDPINAF